ncbi:MAG: hypothetical protein CL840_13440 [Crocinitomicaceae bacterium]|nr:hypothetical protein [Crocinitomicaceae bacterium]|tara:strand:- start:11646 stop:12026 length:381 start_codon:yes stop_codon:yes gene_type:complete
MKVFIALFLSFISFVLFAQEGKTKAFNEQNINVVWKIKSPGLFAKVDSGKILILKVRNVDTSSNSVSFQVSEYLNGMLHSSTGELSNCFQPGKKKKIKVHLENWVDKKDYDWTFTDVVVTGIETCP